MSVVCIAGMHRSGTSLVARLLNLCGVYLGSEDELMPPTPDNVEGYWENLEFVDINNSILFHFNGAWNKPPALDTNFDMQSMPPALVEKAQILIQKFDQKQPIWGWKDPRNSLTLPFWRQLLPDLKVIVCLRNPLEVAQSMARRDNFSLSFSLDLWKTYNQSLLSGASADKRLITQYSTYFEEPQKELQRLLDFIGMTVENKVIENACLAAVPALKHNAATIEGLIAAGAPAEVINIYTEMCSQAGPVYRDAAAGNGNKKGAVTGENQVDSTEYQLLRKLAERQMLQIGEKEQRIEVLSAQIARQEQSKQAHTRQTAPHEQSFQISSPKGRVEAAAVIPNVFKQHETAVILHLFYADMWVEISPYLTNFDKEFDLFVTIPEGNDNSEQLVKTDFPDAQIFRCENRGRDIAPFLTVLTAISKLDYKYICKIHTKKSPHLEERGSEWKHDMLDKLLGSREIIERVKKALDEHADWGLIAPQGHVVPYNYYWRQNEKKVIRLAQAVGIPTKNINFSFVSGSMFWFRPRVFDRLVNIGIRTNHFETEQSQLDGTLAHAIERFFGMLLEHEGYKIAEIDAQEVKPAVITFQFQTLVDVVQSQEEQILSLDAQLAEYTAWWTKSDRLIQTLNSQIGEKDWSIGALTALTTEKDKTIEALTSQIGEKDWSIGALTELTTEKDKTIQALTSQIGEKDWSIGALTALTTEKDKTIQTLTSQIGEKDWSIGALTALTTEKDKSIQTLTNKVAEQAQELDNIKHSRWWRLAQFFRRLRSRFKTRGEKN